LVTSEQFVDIVAQEMYREPGADFGGGLAEVLAVGRARLGDGRYETLLRVGERDGCPMLTFTAPWRAADVVAVAPSAGYLRMIAGGLVEAHGWGADRIAGYLVGLRGVTGVWTREAIAVLVEDL
jgi:hypothetical protein